LGISEGTEPAGKGAGIGLMAAEGALTTMDEMGTAVGFCDAKEKEGVGSVAVEPETEEPETLEPETEAPEEAPEEAAEEAAEAVEGVGVEEVAPLDDAMS
jgi:hypothetical protein